MNKAQLTDLVNQRIGETLRRIREHAKIGCEQVSNRLHRHSLYATQIENGTLRLTVTELHMYAQAIGTSAVFVLKQAGDLPT